MAAEKRGDYATALRLRRPLARAGDAKAQFNIGFLYVIGTGVPQDYAEAVKCYRMAAEQGDFEAQDVEHQADASPKGAIPPHGS